MKKNDTTTDKEFIKYLNENGKERLELRIKTEKGQVVDLVVQYESYIDKKWRPIIRYDCAHGFFHRDILNATGEQEKQVTT